MLQYGVEVGGNFLVIIYEIVYKKFKQRAISRNTGLCFGEYSWIEVYNKIARACYFEVSKT